MEENNVDKIEGFRIGDYFVTFPDMEEIIKEDTDGRHYINVDIFKIDSSRNVSKMDNSDVTPEIEQMISDEIHRLLSEGLDLAKDKHKDITDVKD